MEPRHHGTADAIARLKALPRIALTPLPTPLHRLARFSDSLGADIWIKRDDMGSVGLAGNKVRKYELLLGQALTEGADTLITTGAVQSNSARAGAAAAAQLGLRCVLVLTGEPPAERRANLLLDDLFGAEVRFVGRLGWSGLEPVLAAAAAEVAQAGGRPYVVPVGASSPLGSLGFALAYRELLDQLRQAGLDLGGGDGVGDGSGAGSVAVTAQGPLLLHTTTSGGTPAGLVVGRALWGQGPRPIGVDAGRVLTDPARDLAQLATEAAAVIGLDRHFSAEQIAVELGYAGPGYGSVTEEGLSAIRLLATTEGIVADPVYSGKGLAAVVDLARSGRHEGRPIVFWHTGGWHANFDPHYGDALR